MSGYTTSGATILKDIEVVPHGLLFWRSQTHLLGGMGFLTLTIIFLPHGIGGLRIFRAESSLGQVITKERFLPRNRDAMTFVLFYRIMKGDLKALKINTEFRWYVGFLLLLFCGIVSWTCERRKPTPVSPTRSGTPPSR